MPLDELCLGPACDLYNGATRRLQHSFPAHRLEFRRAFQRAAGMARDAVHLAAIEGTAVRGFASGHVTTDTAVRITSPGDGVITSLCCDSLAAGQKLVDALEEHLVWAGAERIVAFDPGERHNCLPFFNAGFPACPETLPHVSQVLTRAGFSIAARELHLTCELDGAADGWSGWSTPAGITVVWDSIEPKRLEVAAREGDQIIGWCNGHLVRTRQRHISGARSGYITWLGVEPEFQRRGIGRALLRAMMERMAEMGMSRVLLTTGSQNWRAQPLYCSMGFVVVGTSVSFVKGADEFL